MSARSAVGIPATIVAVATLALLPQPAAAASLGQVVTGTSLGTLAILAVMLARERSMRRALAAAREDLRDLRAR